MKTCSHCHTEKPLADYSKKSATKDGLHSWCRACVRDWSAEFHRRNKDKKSEYNKAWREANQEANAERNRRWVKANPEKAREISLRHREANRDSFRVRSKNWRAENPHKANAHSTRYVRSRAAKTVTFDVELFDLVVAEAYKLAKLRFKLTGVPHHVDHIVPLNGKTVTGFHNEWNLQVITKAANLSKSNSYWPDMP